MNLNKRIKTMFFLLLIIILIIGSYEIYISKYHLTTSYYEITTNQISSLRIVQLSDLHNSEFGTNNIDLINEVKDQNPDLIFITGDLVDSSSDNTDIATNLISQLCDICPVYISYGNHEYEFEENYNINLTPLYEDAGGIVLEREYVDITIDNQAIRIGGIYGYCQPKSFFESSDKTSDEYKFLLEFENTNLYTIFMCHMPVCWLKSTSLEEWNIDCIFAGHVHGGQIIIPFIGGLYAPDFGYFPGYLEGLYDSDDGSSTLVLSRGLGSTESVPRFNNIPEVVTVDFILDV